MSQPAARILVIDDDAELLSVVQGLLATSRYAVEIAPGGAAGLKRFAAGGIDLVLLDLMMPDVDGLEVCRRLRQDESQGYIPVIMLTGFGAESAQAAGF